MQNELLFNFSENKENNTISIQREFNASPELVWQAWTSAEMLDQWWGPNPWKANTKTMDFRDGGYWLYAMIGPNGEKHWSKANYISISPGTSFTAKDGFCDENGIMSTEFPQNLWYTEFIAKQNTVLADILLTFDTPADLEMTLKMGYQEGFTQCLDQLDELLDRLSQ